MTIAELQRQVRELKEAKGFDINFEQRLAFLTTEVGEVAREVLEISRGKLSAAELAGVDLEEAFRKKAGLNEGREWR